MAGEAIRYQLIIFDWDGTAVADRHASTTVLGVVLESLLKSGVLIVIVTGTHLQNILGQSNSRGKTSTETPTEAPTGGIAAISVEAKKNLFVCTNRGSEVFNFDERGQAIALYQRRASTLEDQALDRAVDSLALRLAEWDLQTETIRDRLNRRKLDLLPVPEWRDPKKAQFAELLRAVQNRLAEAHDVHGLPELVDEALRLSRAAGLADPRVTSDIKHLEIGLTDKSDSLRWVSEHIVAARRISWSRVAVLGDEFGPIGGLAGSDALMRLNEGRAAHFISVGVEPEGTPRWVDFRGGGPPTFLGFLVDQCELWRPDVQESVRPENNGSGELLPDADLSWSLEQTGFEPSLERQMETLFSLGNGRLGARGGADVFMPSSQPDLFIAGVYDSVPLRQPQSHQTSIEPQTPERQLVPFPSPFRFTVKLDGEPLGPPACDVPEHRRLLDFKQGVSFGTCLLEDVDGKLTRIETWRVLSLADRAAILQCIRVTPLNYSGRLIFDFSTMPESLEVSHPHLEIVDHGTVGFPAELSNFRTRTSGVAIVSASRLFLDGREQRNCRFTASAEMQKTIQITRFISVFTSRDGPEPLRSACQHVLQNGAPRAWRQQIDRHRGAWADFWRDADVVLGEQADLTEALRFNSYHLRIAADHDRRVSVPARTLSGRAYEGHIFWDTEIFMFPFYLFTAPDIARDLLLYRHRTLPGARRRAADMSCRGACFAWESSLSGADVTPRALPVAGTGAEIPVFTGQQQIHVTADVAYAVWRYWQATADVDFVIGPGAEILLETARFWASRVSAAKDESGTLHITQVIGPDEYHIAVDDNVYTNWMARFNLRVAVQVFLWMNEVHREDFVRLRDAYHLQMSELEEWRGIADRLFLPKPNARGVLEQFRGFFALEPVPQGDPGQSRSPIHRLLDWREVNRHRIVKQADVLMLPFLFPDEFSSEQIAANFSYYEPLTDHASSLSFAVHAAAAARAGFRERALDYWKRALYLDLTNSMGNTALGLHAAAAGGVWQALVFHLLDVRLTEAGPRIGDHSLASFLVERGEISLRLVFRGKVFPLTMSVS